MSVLAVLADGQRALPRRRVRPFLCLRANQDRVCDRPLRDGGETSARRARPASRRERVCGGRGLYDRRYGDLAMVWRVGEGAPIRGGRVPAGAGLQECAALDEGGRRTTRGETR